MARIIRFRYAVTALWILAGHFPSSNVLSASEAVTSTDVRSVCCGGVIHERQTSSLSHRSSHTCCGSSTYDADDSICCWNGTFYQLPLPTTMTSSTTASSDNVTVVRDRMDLAYLACCGDRVFDLRDNVCCQETVLTKSNDVRTTSCCGRRLYDVVDEICCSAGDVVAVRNATAADNPSLVQCCGSMPFDPRTHLCCGGEPLVNFDGPDGRCCDGKVYGQRTQVCCAGKIHRRDSITMVCCGQQPFDWERDRCCDNQVFKSVNKSVECCGNATYDTRHFKCCHGIVRQPIDPDIDECCGDILHSTTTDRCCGGVVVVNASLENVGCCRTVAFNPSEGLCCNGVVVPNKEKNRSCCGTAGKTYDTRQELCCNGRAVALPNRNVSSSTSAVGAFKTPPTNLCCSSVAFDPMIQGCCNGMVFTL